MEAAFAAADREVIRLLDHNIELLRTALKEQVDECRDPTCEMCIRHQAILNRI